MYQLNPKPNDLILLLKTIWRYGNCFLSHVTMDGMDGNGLKLEKNWPIFFEFRVPKILKKFIMVSPLKKNSFDIMVMALQMHFVYD